MIRPVLEVFALQLLVPSVSSAQLGGLVKKALPTTYIIDPTGKTVAGEIGLVTQKNLEDYIAAQRGK